MKIKVGYHSNNEVTRRYQILEELPNGDYKVCSFTVMTGFHGNRYLSLGKPTIVDNLKDIHEEEIDAD